MKIIADSGSTQCTWIATDGARQVAFRTRGINAVQTDDGQIAAVLRELPAGFGRQTAMPTNERDGVCAHTGTTEAFSRKTAGAQTEAPEAGNGKTAGAQTRASEADERKAANRHAGACKAGVGKTAGMQASDTSGLTAIVQAEASGADVAPSVVFYGAGCGRHFPEASARMAAALGRRFRTPDVEVLSDLTGAARALFGRGEGIACILGTGSNSCHCRGGEIVENVPPLGYILGDEGSGAALGRNLLNGIFKGYIPLRDELTAATGLDYEAVIRRVYRQPAANRFLASLAPFVHAHTDHPAVREMVLSGFRDFARRNLSRYQPGLPVACGGGVAAHFAELLREALAAEGYVVAQIVESPAEGLIRYHHGA